MHEFSEYESYSQSVRSLIIISRKLRAPIFLLILIVVTQLFAIEALGQHVDEEASSTLSNASFSPSKDLTGFFQIDLSRLSIIEDALQVETELPKLSSASTDQLTMLGIKPLQLRSYSEYTRKYGPIRYWIELEDLEGWDSATIAVLREAFDLSNNGRESFQYQGITSAVFGRYDSDNQSYRVAMTTKGVLTNQTTFGLTVTQAKSNPFGLIKQDFTGFLTLQLHQKTKLSIGNIRMGTGLGLLQSRFLNLSNGYNSLTPFFSHSMQSRGYNGVNSSFSPLGVLIEHNLPSRNALVASKAWLGVLGFNQAQSLVMGFESQTAKSLLGLQINYQPLSEKWIGSLYARKSLIKSLFLQTEFTVDGTQAQAAGYLIRPINRTHTFTVGARLLSINTLWTGEAYRLGSQPERMASAQLEIKPSNYSRQLIAIDLGKRLIKSEWITTFQTRYLWSKSEWGSLILQFESFNRVQNLNSRIFKTLFQDQGLKFQFILLGSLSTQSSPQAAMGLDFAQKYRWLKWGARSYLALQQQVASRLFFPEYQVEGLMKINTFLSDQVGNYLYLEKSWRRKSGDWQIQARAGLQSSAIRQSSWDVSIRIQHKIAQY